MLLCCVVVSCCVVALYRVVVVLCCVVLLLYCVVVLCCHVHVALLIACNTVHFLLRDCGWKYNIDSQMHYDSVV